MATYGHTEHELQLKCYLLHRDGVDVEDIVTLLNAEYDIEIDSKGVNRLIDARLAIMSGNLVTEYKSNYIDAVSRLKELYRISMQQVDKLGNKPVKELLSIVQEMARIQGLHAKAPYDITDMKDYNITEDIRKANLKVIAEEHVNILDLLIGDNVEEE